MSKDSNDTKYLRILLRQQKTGYYLQSSGEWNSQRESAKNFDDSILAYDWAKENGFLGTAVLMATAQEQYDTVLARV